MTATSQATTPPRAPLPCWQGRWRDLMTLPPRTTGLIVVGVLGYLTVAGPGAVLLTALVVRFPLPAALVPVIGLLIGELLLCGMLLTAVATRRWGRLAGLAADRPIRHGFREWRAPLLLLLLGLAVLVVRLAAGLVTGPGQRMLAHTPGGVVVALIVSSMLLVGFNEELLFRGLALGALLREQGATRLGVYQAVITVSVLFGLAHLIRQGPIIARLELAGGTAVIGLMFAAVRLRSGSIWVGAAMHALGDSVQLVGALSVGYFASSIAHGPPRWVAIAGTLLALWFGVAQIEAYLHDREQDGQEAACEPGLARPAPMVGPVPNGNRTSHHRSMQDLTNAQVASLLQVTEQTVDQWAKHGKLPYESVQGRRRYPAAAVAELARDRNIPLPDWLAGIAANAQRGTP